MAELSRQAEMPQMITSNTGESHSIIRGPTIPVFKEGKDKIDSYLRRFERYAQ